jgi:hypothetical protein
VNSVWDGAGPCGCAYTGGTGDWDRPPMCIWAHERERAFPGARRE